MPRFIDRTGQRFGRLQICSLAPQRGGRNYWLCQCDCGRKKAMLASNLVGGKVESCGCLNSDVLIARNTKHGGCGTPEYKSWQAMLGRCINPKDAAYQDYGGRGIVVCDRWRHSFANFLADMGPRPQTCTLDRKDNDGSYSPENCRWATISQQMRNTRRNIPIAHNGRSLLLVQWATETGLRPSTILRRLRLGWSIADALTIPVARSC